MGPDAAESLPAYDMSTARQVCASLELSSGPLFREFAMHRIKRLVQLAVLIPGIGLAAAVWIGPQPLAARSDSGGSRAMPVVLRGSDPVAPQSLSTNDSVPTVLRGSPPPAPQPSAARDVCASDYDYDQNDGCVATVYAINPYDYGYWPYYGFDGFVSGGRHHGLRHGFARGVGRGLAPFLVTTSPIRSARFASGPSRGFAYPGGFGRR
jgi:hypothetical protein